MRATPVAHATRRRPTRCGPRRRCWLPALIGGLALVLVPAASRGAGSRDHYIDLYAGAAWTQDATVEAESESLFSAERRGEKDVEFDPTWLVGARYTTFWGAVGLGVDLWYYAPEADRDLDVWVVPLSLLVYLRKGFGAGPDGAPPLEAYVGGGFALVSYGVEGNFRAQIDGVDAGDFDVDTVGTDAGLDVRVGLRYRWRPGFHLFSEYRYLDADLSSEPQEGDWWNWTAEGAGFHLRSHFAVFGVGWAY